MMDYVALRIKHLRVVLVLSVHISIPSTVEIIGPLAFSNCSRLIEVELCEGLQQIQQNAFLVCYSLERISIPSSVKEIGFGAFMYCSQLRNVELGEGLENIGRYAFAYCGSLERIVVPSVSEWWEVMYSISIVVRS